MLSGRPGDLLADVERLLERHGTQRSALLPVLQDLQRSQHRIDDLAMQVIADRFGIHPVEVHGVVSFYSFLETRRRGRFVVRLCRTLSCDLAGKERIARQLVTDLGVQFGQTTPDGKFTLEWANCIGMCDQGPALLVNEHVHVRVTPERVHQIIASYAGAFVPHRALPGRKQES
jgi:NADH:ubiquinone oxidoreductase subunit E